MLDLIIKNGSCFIEGKLQKMDIGVKNAKIIQIADNIPEEANETFNAQNLIVLPGCMDTQVHFREPGSTDAEDLESGSRAAVLGGVTSLFEMPNTNPPTANLIEFDKKLQISAKTMKHVEKLLICSTKITSRNEGKYYDLFDDYGTQYHFYAFLLLGLLALIAFSKELKKIIIYVIFISIFLEFAHLFIPNRAFEIPDLFGNLIGILLSLIIFKAFNIWRKKK